jgi:uncharacterized protein CbrC (UPF0167 family)
VESDATCECCARARGFAYTGATFGEREIEWLCPWCIADGNAAATLGASFTDLHGAPGDVPAEVLDTIAHRTPGFEGWQDSKWLYHCGDAAVFLGPAGLDELKPHPDAVDCIRAEYRHSWAAADIEAFVASLDKAGPPTAYLFRCRRCGTHLAYSGFD